MKPCRILLADDHPLVRKGLKAVIELLGIASEIVEAENGIQVLESSLRQPVDLFMLDFKMPHMNGYDAAKILLQQNPRAKIIVISMYDDHSLISNFINIGVMGFLLKNTGIDEIEAAIKSALMGQVYFDPALKFGIQDTTTGNRLPLTFTRREKELIQLLSNGRTSKEIAESWGVTFRTIETYRSRLLEKVSVKNTSELLSYFHKNGLS